MQLQTNDNCVIIIRRIIVEIPGLFNPTVVAAEGLNKPSNSIVK
jgi:hypothetical protein